MKLMKINQTFQELLSDLQWEATQEEVFSNVAIGFDADIHPFSEKPVGFCYVQDVPEYYKSMRTQNKPKRVHTAVGFVIKGSQEERYIEAINIVDLLQEKLQNDEEWSSLKNTVMSNSIIQSGVNLVQDNKKNLYTNYNLIIEQLLP